MQTFSTWTKRRRRAVLRPATVGAVLALFVIGCGAGSGGPRELAPGDDRRPDAVAGTDAAAEAQDPQTGDARRAGDSGPNDSGSTPDSRTPPADARTPDVGAPDAALADPTEALFDTSHILEVEVTLAPTDWEALRLQGRDGLETQGADCLDAPFPSPYTWFTAQVTLDGQAYAEVGVRKKGFFGSLSTTKPSLVLDLDRNLSDQAYATLTRFALNNGRQDPSLIRTCLAYEVMADAGVPAPRCAFAHVVVNGADLGLYAHVESLRKPFLRRHFADDSGHLYEGALSDFRPGWSGTIEQKTDEDVPYRSPIDALTAAAAEPDDRLLGALDAVLDLEAFYRFWAAEVLVAHWDGYTGDTNNFWLYDDPGQHKVVFLPWGPDATFQAPRLLFEGLEAPASVLATGILARRLYLHPEGRRRYLETLRDLVDAHFDPVALHARADTFAAMLTPRLPARERRAHAGAVADVKAFIGMQGGRIRAELDVGGAPWDVPLRSSICTVPAGRVTGRFETTWGSWPTDDTFASGTGVLEGSFRDAPLETSAVGGAAGLDSDGGPLLLIPARLVDQRLVYLYVAFDPTQLVGGELSITDVQACTYNLYDPQTRDSTRLASCLDGTLTFDAIEPRNGAPVAGRFDLGLWIGVE